MRCFSLLLPLALTSSLASSALAGPFSNMVVFGDSLSDTGSSYAYTSAIPGASVLGVVRPVGPSYAEGRWTNGTGGIGGTGPGGANYAQLQLASSQHNSIWHWELADRLGIPRAQSVNTPSFPAASRTNFACGAALAGPGRVSQTIPLLGTYPVVDNIGYQVNTQFGVASATMSSSTLYAIWGGANDIRTGISSSTINSVATANAAGAATSALLRGHIQALATRAQAQGVRITVAWPNIVPLDLVPDYADAYGGTSTQRALAQAAALSFRQAWAADIAALSAANPNSLDLIGLDVHSFFTDVALGNVLPASTNRFDPILNFGGFSDTFFTPTRNSLAAVPAGSNPDNYLFWDRIHPTARVHSLLGEYAATIIPAPATLALVGFSGLAAARRRRVA